MAEPLKVKIVWGGRQKGRPSIETDSDEVEFLLFKEFSKSKAAEMLGVSCQTL